MKTFNRKNNGVIHFGKFKGRRWDTLDIEYLEFIVSDKCYTSEENKDKAREELNNKNDLDKQGLMF